MTIYRAVWGLSFVVTVTLARRYYKDLLVPAVALAMPRQYLEQVPGILDGALRGSVPSRP